MCLVRVWVRLRLSCMGCWVRLASFSPCHYCLEIEGGGVGTTTVCILSYLLSSPS